MSAPDRRAMVERPGKHLSVRRQCALVGVARSGVYRPKGLVTLATKEGGGPAALEILGNRDCLAPCAHRRGAESAMG
jgi:hypothetical protein